MSTVNANFSVNQMSPIICSWKLMNHLNCFGDKRLPEKSSYAVLKCVVWPYSVIIAFLTMEFQKNKQEVKQFELCSKLFSFISMQIIYLSIKLKYPGVRCLFCFTYTYMYMQITLHLADFAWNKNVTFDFPDHKLAFLGTLLTLTIKILKFCFRLFILTF